MRPTVSLRQRVVLAGALVVAAVLTVSGLIAYVSVRARLDENLERLLDDRTRLAAELGGTMPADELTDRLSGSDVAVSVDARRRRADLPPAVPDFVPPARARDHGPQRTRSVVLADGTRVELAVSTGGVDDTLRRLLVAEVIGGVAALALAVLLLDRTARRALRPLDDVVATAGRIAAGGSGERLRPDRTDTELGRMAAAFDEMLDALEAALAASRTAEDRSRRFLADSAHQLRTPVAGVAASAEALVLARDEPTRQRLAANLQAEAARLGRLVGTLVHLARADAHPAPAPFDMAAVCRGEVERAGSRHPGLSVTYEGPEDLEVTGVVDLLREAVANLLDNATRHARRQVAVSVAAPDGTVVLSVRDDGPGVPAGAEDRAFDRFVSLDGRGGAGLGLAVVRAAAELHGGRAAWDGAAHLEFPRTGGQAERQTLDQPSRDPRLESET